MKINASSWHYRFNSFVQEERFTWKADRGRLTTCSYIRTTIFSVFQGIFKSVVLFMVGLFALWFVGSMIGVPIGILFGYVPLDVFIGPAVICWVLVAFSLVLLFIKYTKERFSASFEPNGEPNVFFQACLLYTSPSPRDLSTSRMPSSA